VKGSFTSTTQLTIERDASGGVFSGDSSGISWEVINWSLAAAAADNAVMMSCNF
jgi:hypothetical protein